MKILIVDDEKDVQRLFEQRFRKERRKGLIDLHFAFSGEAALDFLRQEENRDITLLLSDVNMPQMSGFELLQAVRAEYPAIRVYMITAYNDQVHHRRALDLGATDFLTKPIDFTELKGKILSNTGV